jgi:LysR family transcriptional activator of nhaA
VVPRVVAELDDAALLEALGRQGLGCFPLATGAPGAGGAEEPGLVRLGEARGASERWFAWTVDRRIRHPAVRAIESSALPS